MSIINFCADVVVADAYSGQLVVEVHLSGSSSRLSSGGG